MIPFTLPPGVRVPTSLGGAGHKWAEYRMLIPAGVTLDTILRPEYWARVANFLHPLDEITCVSENGLFDVIIRLVSKSSAGMTFRIVRQAPVESAGLIRRDNLEDNFRVVQTRPGTWAVKDAKRPEAPLLADGLDKESANAEMRRLVADLLAKEAA